MRERERERERERATQMINDQIYKTFFLIFEQIADAEINDLQMAEISNSDCLNASHIS